VGFEAQNTTDKRSWARQDGQRQEAEGGGDGDGDGDGARCSRTVESDMMGSQAERLVTVPNDALSTDSTILGRERTDSGACR
jgi:hypothetical protein